MSSTVRDSSIPSCVVINVCFQWSKNQKTTDSLKNKIILYKSKKPESVDKLSLLTEKTWNNEKMLLKDGASFLNWFTK